jgi:hypothetical protein
MYRRMTILRHRALITSMQALQFKMHHTRSYFPQPMLRGTRLECGFTPRL